MMHRTVLPVEQRGFILVTSLVFLVVLTLLAVVAINSSTLNQRMAGNQEEKEKALEAADAGLAHAEQLMKTSDFAACANLFHVPNPKGDCSSAAGELAKKINYNTFGNGDAVGWNDVYSVDYTSDAFWSSGLIEDYDLANTGSSAGQQVAYRIDYLPFVSRNSSPSAPDAAYFFLVTARAEGFSSAARAVVQSIFEIER